MHRARYALEEMLARPPGYDGPRVKGLSFRTNYKAFQRYKGEKVLALALDLMPPELASAFRYGEILASGWYPTSWYRDMHGAMRSATGLGLELPRLLGHEGIREDLESVYKQLLLRMLSPERLFALSQRLFNTYYSKGSVDVTEQRRGYVRARFQGCTGFDENMWAELLGANEMLLQMAGATSVRIVVLSGAGAAEHADAEARWT